MQGREQFWLIISKEVGSSEMSGMGDSETVPLPRKPHARIGKSGETRKELVFARLLTQLAAEAFERAGEIERPPGLSAPKPPRPRALRRPHSDS